MPKIIDVTELVLRDAHQSLMATRMAMEDMIPACADLDQAGYWSIECWGGATFDSCIRFLNEDPWERLRQFRKLLPNSRLQMLLRGQNLLGYRHYEDTVVDRFVDKAAENGMDVFRVFDALNDIRNLRRAIAAVRRTGKHAQGTICYTVSPLHTPDDFVEMADKLLELGCDSICIKDMAALLKPQAAFDIVNGIKETCGPSVRVHVHVHATTGVTLMAALRDAAEDIIGYLLIGTDNTARKQAEEALLRSEMLASAGRMAASIAHEINNPLEAVMNTIYLARTTADLPALALEYLDIADGELMRIAHITRQTLGFYREFSAATSNSASALIDSVVNLLQAKIRANGAQVEQQCDRSLRIMGIAGELRQVLANLLANSLEAIGQNGRIVLRAAASVDPGNGHRRVRISVADCGSGLTPATTKRIFEPFFTTNASVGAGLGLWVCKQLVEKNAGSIRVRSITHGSCKGTTFSVLLPRDAAPLPLNA